MSYLESPTPLRARPGKGGFPLRWVLCFWVGWLCAAPDPGEDPLASLLADRAAIERVYHAHRLGETPPFEETLPAQELRRLVQRDLARAAVLERVYAKTITDSEIAAEIKRIEGTTRAPEMLGEIKAALGQDPARFARSFVQPILVERELRKRFENDDSLHATPRRRAEELRRRLLAARTGAAGLANQLRLLRDAAPGTVLESRWRLAPSPDSAATREPASSLQDFGDLPEELQRVLRAQLRHTGDVSAVIEMPSSFLLFVAKSKTDAMLETASVSFPKRDFEEWLASAIATGVGPVPSTEGKPPASRDGD